MLTTLWFCGSGEQPVGSPARGSCHVLAAARTALQRGLFVHRRGRNFALHWLILLHLYPSVGNGCVCGTEMNHMALCVYFLTICFLALSFYALYASKCFCLFVTPHFLLWPNYYWWQLHHRKERRKIPLKNTTKHCWQRQIRAKRGGRGKSNAHSPFGMSSFDCR